TFEAILLPSGQIDLQYLSMQGLTSSGTVGIQNAARDVGLEVAYNTPYVHDNLRVRLSMLPNWLRVTPIAGVTPPGARATLPVTLDASDLADGDHQGMVQVFSNDPHRPSAGVP